MCRLFNNIGKSQQNLQGEEIDKRMTFELHEIQCVRHFELCSNDSFLDLIWIFDEK